MAPLEAGLSFTHNLAMQLSGKIPFRGYETYYQIVNPEGKKTPIIILHGGPGGTHTKMRAIDPLGKLSDRMLIFYDHLGGKLSPVPEGNKELWKMETWMDELENLRSYFGLEKAILLGHSFGGMLTIATNIERKPDWVVGNVLSSTLSSARTWHEEALRLIGQLPKKEQKALISGMEKGDYQSKEFLSAAASYMRHYVRANYRLKPGKGLGVNEAYMTGWGPCEFFPTGTLKDYEYTDRLGEIKVPTLLIHGSLDESTPYQNKLMLDKLSCPKKWAMLPGAHHACYEEMSELYCQEVASFLREMGL
ncbi:MAG: proline iminopeptidase-family hydrolase [Bacillota bacterium]|nr:proline iminopeptidase-family hydrolase [Bacillota bacterium]